MVNPAVSDGTMIALISLEPSAFFPVTHATVIIEVIFVPEFVMKTFEPFMTHSSPLPFHSVEVAP